MQYFSLHTHRLDPYLKVSSKLKIIMKLLALLALFLFANEATQVLSLESTMAPPETYWKMTLPNTPIPQPIKQIFDLGQKNQGKSVKVKLAEINDEEDPTLYFMEQDILPGNTMNLHFTKTTNEATFVPRIIADRIPFSLNKLTEVFNEPDPDDPGDIIVRKTIQRCEELRIKGKEHQSCLTSLESMINFVTTRLGHDIRAINTEVKHDESLLGQNYAVESGVKKIEGSKFVACHKLNYPYAVFYCHAFEADEGYVLKVSLKGSNGAEVDGVGVCHLRPQEWEKYMARVPTRMAAVKSGKVPLCHFLAGDSIVWTNKKVSV